jgi:hypothetical protein
VDVVPQLVDVLAQLEMLWLSCGGALSFGMLWLSRGCGSSVLDLVAQSGMWSVVEVKVPFWKCGSIRDAVAQLEIL